jgi:hypothetical protein
MFHTDIMDVATLQWLWGVTLPNIYEPKFHGVFYLPCDRLAAAAGFVSAINGERHHTRLDVTHAWLPNWPSVKPEW